VKEETAVGLMAGGMIALLLVVVLGTGAIFGHLAYHDWTCGMPGVHCRKLK